MPVIEKASGFETLSSGLAQAPHYWDWVYSELKPALGQSILEIGPGFGELAERILQDQRAYSAVDNASEVITRLRNRLAVNPERLVIGDVTDPVVNQNLSSLHVDTLISMNVLEHVENDLQHLNAIRQIAPKFRLILFVPALPILYGSFDRAAGHYRRYTPAGIRLLLEKIGARSLHIRYFNALGAAAWFAAARLFHCELGGEGTRDSIVWYDRWVIPMARLADPLGRRWVGQSLIAVGDIGPA